MSMAVVVVFGMQLLATTARAQGAAYDDENAEVLTRGPVHEAFATVVDYNPGRGYVARKAPPDPIEEVPPEERPTGDDVTWIPGYWAWDDDASDYIWVSGTWRVPPPGREWIAGYWADSDGEFIWISGYWGEIEVRETTYLPPPPRSLESGPNIDRPSLDYGWSPGCWVWYDGRYAWRAGYWARGRGDWVWIPSYYVWTPHGYIFIDGYWDYVVARRGIVYAPVHFRSRVYARRGYYYTPSIVFNLGLFSDHLFLRPRSCHYYFGDYYASRYEDAGFYFAFSYHNSRRGYDPFYSYRRWENRRDRDWESRYQASYRYRRENEAARPPGTWSAQVSVATSTTTSTQSRIVVAGTTSQLSSTKDFSVKFRKVSEDERRTYADRGQQVRTSREQRRTLEFRPTGGNAVKSGEIDKPTKIERPKSPIASKPTRQLSREHVPPKAQATPRPDARVRPASAAPSGRSDDRPEDRTVQSRGNRPAEERPQAGDSNERRAAEERTSAANARKQDEAQAKRKAGERERAAKAESQQQAKERAVEAQRKNEQQAAERRAKEAEARARNEAQVREREAAAQRAKDAEARERGEANQRAKEPKQQKSNEVQKQEKGKRASDEEESSAKDKDSGRP